MTTPEVILMIMVGILCVAVATLGRRFTSLEARVTDLEIDKRPPLAAPPYLPTSDATYLTTRGTLGPAWKSDLIGDRQRPLWNAFGARQV